MGAWLASCLPQSLGKRKRCAVSLHGAGSFRVFRVKPLDNDVHKLRVEFDAPADASGLRTSHQRRAASEEGVEYYIAPFRGILDRFAQ